MSVTTLPRLAWADVTPRLQQLAAQGRKEELLEEVRSVRASFRSATVNTGDGEPDIPGLDDVLHKYEQVLQRAGSPEALRDLTDLYITDLAVYDRIRAAAADREREDDAGSGPLVCGLMFMAAVVGGVIAGYERSWPVALACAFAAHLLGLTWWVITRPFPPAAADAPPSGNP